jgi:predicted small secreted protein
MKNKKVMEKFLDKLPIITFVILCCTFLYTCNTNRNASKVIKTNNKLIAQVDSLKDEIKILSDSAINTSDFKLILELEGYKISKRNLYYTNAIVRTKERPDDVMHKYDQAIESLTKKLK